MRFAGRVLVLAVLCITAAGCGGGRPAELSLSQSDVTFSAPFGGQNPAARLP
jgi:ABC-type glycerol-3-phosphate transport system substrate-binding protein